MEKWFSNRGQMVQVLCAVLAVALGIVVNWQQLSSTFDFVQLLRVLVYPAAVLFGLQIGKYVQTKNSITDDRPRQSIRYKYLTPTVKVGSYFDIGSEQLLSLDRVSVISIGDFATDSEVPAALVETAGSILYLSFGSRTKKVTDSRFMLQANPRLKTEDYSVFHYLYQKESFSITSISVDHINLTAQEVTFAICMMQFRTGE